MTHRLRLEARYVPYPPPYLPLPHTSLKPCACIEPHAFHHRPCTHTLLVGPRQGCIRGGGVEKGGGGDGGLAGTALLPGFPYGPRQRQATNVESLKS